MANTGYIITPSLVQKFATGNSSGSLVTGSFGRFTTLLGVAPFSASLDNKDYYYRTINEETCPEGFEDCLKPILTSVNTGSQKGYFDLNYTSSTSFNAAVDITGSISDHKDFSVSQTFSASIGTLLPISSSYTSGTVYFRAFQSCSGPEKSPNSELLEFTYAPLPPPSGVATINLQNTLSTPITLTINDPLGNVLTRINAGATYAYTFITPPNRVTNPSLVVIKMVGGAAGSYGQAIIKRMNGNNSIVHISSPQGNSGFNGTDGGSFTFYNSTAEIHVNQRGALPFGQNVVATLIFSVNSPPPPVVTPPPPTPAKPVPYTPRPTIRFGSSVYSSVDAACGQTDFRSTTYYQFGNYLYLTENDAIAGNRPSFPASRNYILTNTAQYAIVSSNGYIIQSAVACSYPTITISKKTYSTQEDACRDKTFSTQQVQIKGSELIGFGGSGRFKYSNPSSRGGQNVIISGRRIVAYETCGTEGSSVTYTRGGAMTTGAVSLDNPYWQKYWCKYTSFRSYFLGPSGTVYYSSSGKYAYIPLGLGTRVYFDQSKNGYLFNRGKVASTYNLNCSAFK
jgi:hypothetical protein